MTPQLPFSSYKGLNILLENCSKANNLAKVHEIIQDLFSFFRKNFHEKTLRVIPKLNKQKIELYLKTGQNPEFSVISIPIEALIVGK